MAAQYYTLEEIELAKHLIRFLIVIGVVATAAAFMQSRLVFLLGAVGAHLGYSLGHMTQAYGRYDGNWNVLTCCVGATLGCIAGAKLSQRFPSSNRYSLRMLLFGILIAAIALGIFRLGFDSL